MNPKAKQNNRNTTLRGLTRPGLALTLSAIAATVSLAGCNGGGLSGNFGVGTAPTPSVRFSGNVYGGQQPISNATVLLYGVNQTTLQGASTSILTTPTTTDANGNFNITGAYNCTGVSNVYIVAQGGNPTPGVPNSTINMVAALGDCATLQANAANIFINMNEISTAVAAYVLAPFASDLTHVGSPNATALTNAFNTANELYNLRAGTPGGTALAAGATVPGIELNTLGNILASCVNTNGAGSSQCSTLYTATGATETFGAALAIAKNSGSPTITGLYVLSSGTAPFQPSMATQPNDFSVAVNYNAAGTLATPYGIALDATGNAWVTNESGNSLTEFSSNGVVLASPTTTGLYGAQGVAVDRNGNVWVANTAGNSVVKFSLTAGAVTGSASYTVGGVLAPTSIAMDSAGNAFVSNLNGNSVSKLTAAGAAASGSPFTAAGGITVPSGLALDASGNVLVTSGTGTVVKLTNAGVLSSTLNDNTLQGPLGVVVDGSGNILVSGSTTGAQITGAIGEFTSAGAASNVSPASTGVATPFGLASDGATVWVANSVTAGSLARLQYGSATPLSPTAGFGSINTPVGVAVDASGNVWTANSGSNTVSKFVGIATPVATPIAVTVGP